MHSTVKKLVNSGDVAMKGMNVSSFTKQLGFSMITSIIPRAQTCFFHDLLSAIKILAIIQCVYTVHEISRFYYYREKKISGLQMGSFSPPNHQEFSSD